MNQARIWCVVKPTVGLPLFLGSVAVTSLIVHGAILANTTWFPGYFQGGAKRTAELSTPAPAVAEVQDGQRVATVTSPTSSQLLASVALPSAATTPVITTGAKP